MILNFYLLRRLLWAFLQISGVFLGMLLLLEMFELLRRLSGVDIGFGQLLFLSILRILERFYEITTLVLMLAALAVGLAFSRSSEIVVIRAVGRSMPRLLVVPTLVMLVVSAAFVAAMNPMVAAASREGDRLMRLYSGDDAAVAVFQDGEIWLRQADDGGQTVISARNAEATGTVLHQVTMLVFDDRIGLSLRLSAARAELRPGVWQLHDVKRWDINHDNPEASAQFLRELDLPSSLTPEQIRDNFAQVRSIALSQLPQFIAALERAGFSSIQHRMRLHMELAAPLLMTGMVLLALGLSLHHWRAGGAGIRALFTILAGFALFFLRNFAQVLGESGQIPVALAAWGLPVATLLLGMSVLLNSEER